jgi:hypothetical protein
MVNSSLVVVLKGCIVAYVNDPENRELVTSTKCISASGYYVLLIITFKGVYYLCKYFKNEIDGNIPFSRSDSGFVNNKLTLCWLKHFNDFTEKQTVRRYRMLIFDGYGSHIT